MKIIRNLILIGFILFIIFIAMAIGGEGDKFRLVGKQIGGIASIVGEKLANEANSIRKKALELKKSIEGLATPSPEKEPVKGK
ncbi:MAG: hypothetical protein N2511_03955 [Thermodesulfovibrionales bacterium]|nr:hypothetical protein [Thermodesulfovibrionales bacterium]